MKIETICKETFEQTSQACELVNKKSSDMFVTVLKDWFMAANIKRTRQTKTKNWQPSLLDIFKVASNSLLPGKKLFP